MHSLQLLCSFLICNCLVVAAQRKLQKIPEEEEEEEMNFTKIRTPQTLSRGWGDEIDWVQTYEEALARSRNSKKPVMVIHHLEECPYSQALRKAFVSSPDIQKMAQEDFIMINLVHSSTDDNMAPDGHYVPRILFVGTSAFEYYWKAKLFSPDNSRTIENVLQELVVECGYVYTDRSKFTIIRLMDPVQLSGSKDTFN